MESEQVNAALMNPLLLSHETAALSSSQSLPLWGWTIPLFLTITFDGSAVGTQPTDEDSMDWQTTIAEPIVARVDKLEGDISAAFPHVNKTQDKILYNQSTNKASLEFISSTVNRIAANIDPISGDLPTATILRCMLQVLASIKSMTPSNAFAAYNLAVTQALRQQGGEELDSSAMLKAHKNTSSEGQQEVFELLKPSSLEELFKAGLLTESIAS